MRAGRQADGRACRGLPGQVLRDVAIDEVAVRAGTGPCTQLRCGFDGIAVRERGCAIEVRVGSDSILLNCAAFRRTIVFDAVVRATYRAEAQRAAAVTGDVDAAARCACSVAFDA